MNFIYQTFLHLFQQLSTYFRSNIFAECFLIVKQKGFHPLLHCIVSFSVLQFLPRFVHFLYYTVKSTFDPYWAGFRLQTALSFLVGSEPASFETIQPWVNAITFAVSFICFCFFGNANLNAFRNIVHHNIKPSFITYFGGGWQQLHLFIFRYSLGVILPLLLLKGIFLMLNWLPFTDLTTLAQLVLHFSHLALLFLMIANFVQRESHELLMEHFQTWVSYACLAFFLTSLFNFSLLSLLIQLFLIPYTLIALDRSSQIVQSVVLDTDSFIVSNV